MKKILKSLFMATIVAWLFVSCDLFTDTSKNDKTTTRTETTDDKTETIVGNKTFENIKVPVSGKSGDKVTISFTVTGAANYKQLGMQTLLDNQAWHEAPWAEGGLSDPLNYEVEVTAGADFLEVVFKCFLQEAINATKSSNVKITNIKATIKTGSNTGNGENGGGGNGGNEGDNTTPSDPIEVPTVSGGSFTDHGKLSVNGKQLVDKNGAKFILRGISTHGIADGWYPQYVNKDAFKDLRDNWGANGIRLAMYSAGWQGYCTGGETVLKERVENGIAYATELGMYVIVDWHILSDGDNGTPMTFKSKAKEFFTYIASKYKNYDNILYEICNEPNGGTTWETVKAYAEEIIPIIKEYNSDAIIIVGTPTWSQDVDIAANNPITGFINIMYTFHFYAAEHYENPYRQKVRTALSKGLPIFCTEFGLSPASGDGTLDLNSGKEWLDFFDENGISYFCWSLCNKGESSALLKSSCTKTSGWTSDDRSEAGNWIVGQYNARNSN